MKFITNKTDDNTCIIEQGMRFKNGPTSYILARVGESLYCLVSLEDGNRWHAAGSLEDVAHCLNRDDFELSLR